VTKEVETMNPHVTAITLGVRDMDRAKRFYAEGLGCPIDQDHGIFVSFNLGQGSSLALYGWDAAAQDAGVAPEGSGFRGVAFHYIVDSAARVDEMLAAAKSAGGEIVKPAQDAQWGGYFGYFSDPDGYLWKVASGS
jgi:uncharacterized protein